MAKPTVVPEWNTDEVNSTEPDATHKLEGWLDPGGVPEKPPFEYFNFWMNLVWKWINYFIQIVIPISSIANLRSITYIPGDGDTVPVTGYHAGTENRDWFFRWNAASTVSDDNGFNIKVALITVGRWERMSDGFVNPEMFGAYGDGINDDTTAIQEAANFSSNIDFLFDSSYLFGSISLLTGAQINGNWATIIPLTNPDELFLVPSSGGVRAFRDIKVWNFYINGDATSIVHITGSSWGDATIENINSLSGTGFALVHTDILTGVNPSGLTLKNLNARHSSGYKHGWYSDADSVTASIDNAYVDHINIWPIANGYPLFVNHVLSANSYITRLYHGAGGGAGGGIMNVYQMLRGTIGNLWSEASNGDVDALQGSYRDVDINKIVMQTDTATESGDTRFVKAHMFNCKIGMCIFTDDNASGYERDNSPPANYKCFVFEEDASLHISRDVRIGNIKGNFNEGHITRDTGQGIYYTEKPGSSYINTKFDSETFDTTTPGISIAPGFKILDISNWEWGYLEEGLKIVIAGTYIANNPIDVRFYIDTSALTLGSIVLTSETKFIITAFIKTFNDGADRLSINGFTVSGDAIINNGDSGGSAFNRTDIKSSGLYIRSVTLDPADSVTIDYISVNPVRSTVR